MKNRAVLLSAALLASALCCGACASAPSTERPSVDRPEIQRADSVEPAGLTEMRNSIGDQRAAARDTTNALSLTPNTLSQHPDQTFLESVFSPMADVMQFIRNF